MQEFSSEQSFDQSPTFPANPFADLLGESIAPSFVKRGRGRPRKHNLPEVSVNTISHKMGDSVIEFTELDAVQRKLLVDFFKVQIKFNSLREAIELASEKFGITYTKAHQNLSNYF